MTTLTLSSKPTAQLRFFRPSADPAMDAMLAQLGRQYPRAFRPGRALATGVRLQLLAHGYDKAVLGAVLKRWCRSTSYLQALARGGYRVNLDGSRADQITSQQQAIATIEVRRRTRQQKPKSGNRPVRPAPLIVIKKPSRAYSINASHSSQGAFQP